jgi:hypothetical protein
MQSNGLSASVLTDRWMLVLHLRMPRNQEDVDDESCRYNVRESHLEEAARLRQLLTRWLERGRARHWESESLVSESDVQQALAELGYVSVEGGGTSEWFDAACGCSRCERSAQED